MDEGFIQLSGSARVLRCYFHFDSGIVQTAEPLSRHQRIRIFHGGHHTSYARLDQRVGAGRRASVMRARLE